MAEHRKIVITWDDGSREVLSTGVRDVIFPDRMTAAAAAYHLRCGLGDDAASVDVYAARAVLGEFDREVKDDAHDC